MEMHMVHYNDIYDTFDEASDKPNGLAVIGLFFRTSLTQSEALQVSTVKLSLKW